MKKYLLIIICISLMFIGSVNASEFKIHSNNAILYNLEEDTVMYEKNSDSKAMIASLTKVMSAYTVLAKNPDLNKKIKLKDYVNYEDLLKKDLMVSKLDENKEYTYKDILYAFIMESAADCGYALAIDSSGSIDKFVKDMNVERNKLGMKNSNFSNPVGLDDKNNYSTMSDMLILFKAALKNEDLKSMMSTFKYQTEDGKTLKHSLYPYTNPNSKNAVARSLYMDYLKGGKTGTETIPGHALMSYANKNGTTYMLVTTNAKDDRTYPEHVEDAKTIYSYYYNTYGYKTLIKKDYIINTLKTKYMTQDRVNISSPVEVKYFTDKSFDENRVVLKYEGVQTVTPKYKKGDKLGNCYVYYNNNLIKTIKVTMPFDPHMDFMDFVGYYKYLFIAGVCYLIIIIATIKIVKHIKRKKA